MNLQLGNSYISNNNKFIIRDAKFVFLDNCKRPVISLRKNAIYISFLTSLFSGCTASSNLINIVSQASTVFIKRCCFSTMHTGYIFYLQGSSSNQGKLNFEQSSSANLYSTKEKSYILGYVFRCSFYNSSYGTTCLHGDLYCSLCKDTLTSFVSFYYNKLDILYICNHSNSTFVGNSKSNGNYGLVHTNYDSCWLYCSGLIFKDNPHYILNALRGHITISDSYANSWAYSGAAPSFIRTNSLDPNVFIISSINSARCFPDITYYKKPGYSFRQKPLFL